MVVVVPLLTVVLALTAVTVWWLLAYGDVHVLLHDLGGQPMGQGRVSAR
jgi:hypothetical protein